MNNIIEFIMDESTLIKSESVGVFSNMLELALYLIKPEHKKLEKIYIITNYYINNSKSLILYNNLYNNYIIYNNIIILIISIMFIFVIV